VLRLSLFADQIGCSRELRKVTRSNAGGWTQYVCPTYEHGWGWVKACCPCSCPSASQAWSRLLGWASCWAWSLGI